MKKLIFISFLFLGLGTFAQTKIAATLVRNSPSDTYPVTFDSLQRGGMHIYSTIGQRDSIPAGLRKVGMFATVDTLLYQLKGGITNSNWSLFKPGGGSQNLQQVTSIDSVSTRKVTVGGFGNTGIRTYENNAAALADSLRTDRLVEGDEYYLPYNDGAFRKAIFRIPPPEYQITLEAIAGETKTFSAYNDAGENFIMTVDWGNNSKITYPSNTGNLIAQYVYSTTGNFNVKVFFSSPELITIFSALSDKITLFTGVINTPNIKSLQLSSNKLLSFTDSIPNSLQFLNIAGNRNLSVFTTKIPATNTVLSLRVHLCAVSSVLVDDILRRYELSNINNVIIKLESQLPSAPPSAAGISSKNILIGRGCTITTD